MAIGSGGVLDPELELRQLRRWDIFGNVSNTAKVDNRSCGRDSIPRACKRLGAACPSVMVADKMVKIENRMVGKNSTLLLHGLEVKSASLCKRGLFIPHTAVPPAKETLWLVA